jgi:hypothetical protein
MRPIAEVFELWARHCIRNICSYLTKWGPTAHSAELSFHVTRFKQAFARATTVKLDHLGVIKYIFVGIVWISSFQISAYTTMNLFSTTMNLFGWSLHLRMLDTSFIHSCTTSRVGTFAAAAVLPSTWTPM